MWSTDSQPWLRDNSCGGQINILFIYNNRKRYVTPFERGSLQEIEQMQQSLQQNNTSHSARYETGNF